MTNLFLHHALILLLFGYTLATSNLFLNLDGASTPNLENVLPVENSFADSDLFSALDEIALSDEESATSLGLISFPFKNTITSLPFSSDNQVLEPSSSIFESKESIQDPSEDTWNNDEISSSCIDTSITQPNKLQARENKCPISPSTPLTIPVIPDLDDLENILLTERVRSAPPYIVTVSVGGRSITAEEPEFYCNYEGHVLNLEDFKIPVCGPNQGPKPYRSPPTLYQFLEPSKLRKSTYL